MAANPIAAVMIHVADVGAALLWYERAFPEAVRVFHGDPAFECLSLHGVQLEFVPRDSKVSSGPCGSVIYYRVAHFDAALAHFQRLGSSVYRGPIDIENSQRMCQVQDPWGNCVGIRGVARYPEPKTEPWRADPAQTQR